jgi:hypothetical protein
MQQEGTMANEQDGRALAEKLATQAETGGGRTMALPAGVTLGGLGNAPGNAAGNAAGEVARDGAGSGMAWSETNDGMPDGGATGGGASGGGALPDTVAPETSP